MKPIEFIDRALLVIRSRYKDCPELNIYLSVINQLEYVRGVLDGSEQDKSKIRKLTFGSITAKNFDDTDTELSDVLTNAFYVARQIGNGLKMELPPDQQEKL